MARKRIEKSEIDHDLRLTMEKTARTIATGISQATGGRVGFCLFLFEFGEGGVSSYVSNCARADMEAALREFLNNDPANEILGEVH